MNNKIIKECPNCGVKKSFFPSAIKNGEGKFCSRKCKGESSRTRIDTICNYCNKPFTYVPSKKQNFCSHSCHASSQIAEKHSNFKGNVVTRAGYKFVYIPKHPYARNSRIKLCRLVVENKIGRLLDTEDVIHHINGNKLDDRPENLYLTTKAEHIKIHRKNIRVESNI